ncbi:ribosome maturation factor RimP [Cellulomonas chitinilytica]|uniref:Ribosome maturation factor RimP n=1 Tax=Cellulomonas chitinilytica TaxID=398759 RepID=A0A919U0E4_9CELL|nr:ribosome maturation factor RimP [Cellulomonas chitinilytica]GIG21863.1 ribosome maturation factor RimP [Cellulomonas chitinilytica]
MVAPAPAQRVREVVEPAVVSAGLVLEDVAVTRAGARSVVRVVVDLGEDDEGELDLDRVADATRAVSDALDARDVVAGEYTLEVSSPGVSRPLTQRRHFVRAVGRTVTLRLLDGGTLGGRLTAVEPEGDGGGGGTLVVVPVTPGQKGRRPKLGDPVHVPLAGVRDGRVEVDLSGLGPVHDEHGPVDDEHGPVDDDEAGSAGQES